MGSRFFKGPDSDSSDSDSSSEAEEAIVEEPSTKNSDNDSSGVELELTATESLPSNAGFTLPETDGDATVPSAGKIKDNMLAALLEDYYKSRAAEFMNASGSSTRMTRESPEVQALAHQLYSDANRTLTQNGVMSSIPSSSQQSEQNKQYLSLIDRLALANIKDGALQGEQQRLDLRDGGQSLALVKATNHGSIERIAEMDGPLAQMMKASGRLSVPSPHTDLVLSTTRATQHSHYEASFQQLRLLGKGGFGKVYHAHSIFDRKEYAIKKIPLSQRLTLRYQQGGLDELESVLREVQALAQLDHSNVVRYHATWIEEPKHDPVSPPQMSHMPPIPHQRLLADRPHTLKAAVEPSDGVVFGFDSSRQASLEKPEASGWSMNEMMDHSTSMRESQLFTDGLPKGSSSNDSSLDDTVCVLHVQMSLYPTTLSQYLAATPPTSSSPPSSPRRRHCFHLVPSLRIILGILCGLQYVHTKGLIHRDIKPGNIFLSTQEGISTSASPHDGFYDVGSCGTCSSTIPSSSPPSSLHINPRIGDFGLVAELARSEVHIDHSTPPSSPSKPVGTEYYRPPRPTANMAGLQRAPPKIDEKIDVYALGVIMVELLWRCDTASERMHVLKDLQKGRLPKSFVAVIDTEGYGDGVGAKVSECVNDMLRPDAELRLGCQQVKDIILEILGRCEDAATKLAANGSSSG